MARDAPVIFISVVAAIFASSYLNAGSITYISLDYIVRMILIIVVIFFVVFFLILTYSIIAMLIRRL